MGVKVIKAAVGGCTHFVTTASDQEDATTTIGFAQGVVSDGILLVVCSYLY